jgi:glycosyltransferase involved in cell wall biosynthesis
VSTSTRPQEGTWRLLFSGQLIPRKGVDVLLQALALVRPQLRIVLRLVYHNPTDLPAMQALALQLGLAEDVIFVGRRDASGMAEEYLLAHALVLPSRAGAESLPSVITESLLAQKPVVASADAGIPEQVLDAGVLATPGDVASLAAALVRLTSGYERFAAAAQRRSTDMHPEYDIDTMVDRHLELYETLLTARPGRRAVRWIARSKGA